MNKKMKELTKLINEVDKFCHKNEIEFIFVAEAKDKTFSMNMVSKGANSILNKVTEVIETLKNE